MNVPYRVARQAPRMKVLIGARVIPGGAIAVGELCGEVAADERLEGLIDRRQGDVGNLIADGGVDIVRSRVRNCPAKEAVNCRALLSEALALGLERNAERFDRLW
jgi:hypothetical protein